MIISESNVSMSSTRQYSQFGSIRYGISGASSMSGTAGQSNSATQNNAGKGNEFWDTVDRLLENPVSTRNVSNTGLSNSNAMTPSQYQNEILSKLLQRFLNRNVFGSFAGTSSSQNGGMFSRTTTYAEYESTSFSASGQAKTADGRVIDFGIELYMSRSYMEYTDISIPNLNNALMDPLVINLDNGITSISDQKFLFDLDMDGQKEEISTLGRGSGFLALDINGDGEINDGRELFGAKTGDGFGELREYDSDGNGWIDEADEVFSRLKVWCVGENGESVLMSLKDADVGAIYLGEQSTEFSEYGMNGLNGVIRSTGFFLKESGQVGTIQHVDLATENDVTNNNNISFPSEGFPVGDSNQKNVISLEIPRYRKGSHSKEKNNSTEENEKRRINNLERKRELNALLAKKRKARREMLDKQFEKNLERRKKYNKMLEAYHESLDI